MDVFANFAAPDSVLVCIAIPSFAGFAEILIQADFWFAIVLVLQALEAGLKPAVPFAQLRVVWISWIFMCVDPWWFFFGS